MRQPSALLLVLLAACAAPPAPERHEPRPSPAELEAAFEARLRELVPGLPPLAGLDAPQVREALDAALEAGRRAALPPRLAELEEALERDDLESALETLSALVRERLVARAQVLAPERPGDALALLERAHELAPQDPEILRRRGEAALVVGLAEEDPRLLAEALTSLRAAAEGGAGARAWVGASRAARALGEGDEALALARRALEPGATAIEASVALGASRALCEASIDLYLERRSAAPADAQAVEAAWREARGALGELLARAPRDAWAHERLALLLELSGSLEGARDELLAGLRAAPEDERLHERLGEVARRLGGGAAVRAAYDALAAAVPDSPAVLFHGARERFDEALEGLRTSGADCARFAALERDFARCRALSAAWSAGAREQEILCRVASGWCLLAAGELARAHEAFLSADDLERGRGLLLALPGRLESGVRGLAAVADASNDTSSSDPNSLERAAHVERACKVYDFLHAYQPESLAWAREAGFFDRDAAVLFEQRARALARRGELEQANQLLAQARETMERSYRAWVDACELAPDDLRIHADAGRVLVLYLQRDLAEAERLLRHAVELGERQIPLARARLAGAGEEERPARRQELEALEIAFGDACESLGVLHLTLKSDPRSARRWLERALAEGGPDPRPAIDGRTGEGASAWPEPPWLALCARAEAGELDPKTLPRWAAPLAKTNAGSR